MKTEWTSARIASSSLTRIPNPGKRIIKGAPFGVSRKHGAVKLLRQIPSIGPIRAALLVALLQTQYRFRTKRQLWAYIGLALTTHTSGEYRFERGQLRRSKKALAIRGLNRNYNHDLKNIFKGAATWAAANSGPFKDFYEACVARGT